MRILDAQMDHFNCDECGKHAEHIFRFGGETQKDIVLCTGCWMILQGLAYEGIRH